MFPACTFPRLRVVAVAVAACCASSFGQSPGVRPILRYAEVNANDVYVRSGDSTNHYTVCKLQAGDKVAVLSQRGEWVEILPPEGTFSLISGDYVDTTDDKTGVVSGDRVRVRAGSNLNDSKYTVQAMLDRGASVTILGRNPDGFLKIKPPAGATLWIHADFIADTLGGATPRTASTADTATPIDSSAADAGDTEPTTGSNAIASPITTATPKTAAEQAANISIWRTELEEVDAGAKLEMEKLPADRNFDEVKRRFGAIAEQDDDEYAKRYAQVRLAQIENIELLAGAVERVKGLGRKATTDRQSFMEERASMRPTTPDIPSGVTAQGELRVSALYPPGSTVRRYRLIDPTADFERTIGYVEIPPHSQIVVRDYIGRYVGVRASATRLQSGGVNPVPIFVAEELIPMEAPALETGVKTEGN